MKIINEKGKLFGIINVVDLLVLLLIVAVAAAGAVHGLKGRSAQEGVQTAGEEMYCYATIVTRLQPPEMGDYLNVGDHLVANGSYTEAEIVSVDVQPGAYVGVNSDGVAVESTHPIWKDITVVAKQKLDPNSVTLKLGGQEIRVGYDYILKTQNVEAKAVIRGIEWKSE